MLSKVTQKNANLSMALGMMIWKERKIGIGKENLDKNWNRSGAEETKRKLQPEKGNWTNWKNEI